ncbi:hypothetical protein Ahy_B07g086626 isoform B [Arachis hypogaea]|uniref:peptidylprolyl isomerase n=1 Tax=Arachis hypogaea TaxID=3818 RepID=A0A444YA59_ARAHY|nr:hypothetical protein Ahy_B07g086626 isoform B [Arachis hypogaea]
MNVPMMELWFKLQDGTVFVKKGHDDEQPFEFKIDEEQVIDRLDKAVMNMKKGEVALVTIHPEYAFGSSGSTQELATVPPNSNVYYEVELVSFVKVRENCLMFLMFYGSDNIKNNTNLIKIECRKRNCGI